MQSSGQRSISQKLDAGLRVSEVFRAFLEDVEVKKAMNQGI
jgi:hypothetical protein